jgi:phosphoribosyl 1,2-cyclic phosphodiesterase
VKVAVLGSGSRGNAFAVSTRGATLVIDAGFGPKTLAKRARAAGIALDAAVGVVLTHEHGDHARGADRLAHALACPLFASAGTLAALSARLESVTTHTVEPHRRIGIGPFTVMACRTTHDAAEPLALRVCGPADGATVGFAYDLGHVSPAVRSLLRGCQCLVIEANHDDALLHSAHYPPSVRRRIAGSGGHLSNHSAAGLAGELVHQSLDTVVLVHVSDHCNRPELAQHTVSERLRERGFRGRVLVAEQTAPLAAFDVLGPDLQHVLELPV